VTGTEFNQPGYGAAHAHVACKDVNQGQRHADEADGALRRFCAAEAPLGNRIAVTEAELGLLESPPAVVSLGQNGATRHHDSASGVIPALCNRDAIRRSVTVQFQTEAAST